MQEDMTPLRIGEFSRRVGVSPELLRAWERRYGLLRPHRSPGGFRLYGADDVARVARMQRELGEGRSAAQAAQAAQAALVPERFGSALLEEATTRLLAAIRAYDERGANEVVDQSLDAFGFPSVLQSVLFPTLREVGARWQRHELTVAHEHFASNVIRARLLGLARLWGVASGPSVLLACAAHELHDIPLLALGLALRSYGWRIVFLGADTPGATVIEAAGAMRPALAVISSFDPDRLAEQTTVLRRLGRGTPLALAGPGATETLSTRVGARRLALDPVAAAAEIVERPR
jgi:DNA-binding transcriptional MerR regulator